MRSPRRHCSLTCELASTRLLCKLSCRAHGNTSSIAFRLLAPSLPSRIDYHTQSISVITTEQPMDSNTPPEVLAQTTAHADAAQDDHPEGATIRRQVSLVPNSDYSLLSC